MNRHIELARETMHPNWDRARERRVLERVREERAGRSRTFRVLAWSSAAATAVVLLRVMPVGGWEGGSVAPRGNPAVSEPSTANPPPNFTDGGDREG